MKKWLVLFLITIQSFVLSAQEGSVVCIHGFLGNKRSMGKIAQSLRCVGLPVCNWDYDSRKWTIEEHACHLIPLLQQLACNRPGEPIHFVTHSIGALILRAALNIPDCPPEARLGRAVLIAPPNQGSLLGRRFQNFFPVSLLFGSKSGWQLLHYTACDIECLGSFPDSMQVLIIAGTKGSRFLFNVPNDGYIAINETVLDTPYYWTSFPVCHGELLNYCDVITCLRGFLYWGYPVPD